MEDGILILQIHLLALDDDWSGVDKEGNGHGEEDDGRRDEEVVDLADVYDCDDDGDGALDVVDEGEGKGVIQDAEVVGEFVDEDSGWGNVEEFAGAADDSVDHLLVDALVGIEEGHVQEEVLKN